MPRQKKQQQQQPTLRNSSSVLFSRAEYPFPDTSCNKSSYFFYPYLTEPGGIYNPATPTYYNGVGWAAPYLGNPNMQTATNFFGFASSRKCSGVDRACVPLTPYVGPERRPVHRLVVTPMFQACA